MAAKPFFYMLGTFYGDAAIGWMERKAPSYGRLMRVVQERFPRAAYPLVFIAPNNFICLLAGANRLSIPLSLFVALVGTIARLYIISVIGDIFGGPIEAILRVVSHYRLPLLAASVAIVAVTLWNAHRQGKGEIHSLAHLDAELIATDDELPPPA